MILTTKTGTYIDPRRLGAYPNATLEYKGDRHNSDKKIFTFIFELLTENGDFLSQHQWDVRGDTPSGSTIQNHGELTISGGTSGETTTDFVTFVQGGGDLEEPTLVVNQMPSLSYDDIDSYFILGNKKDKVLLPANANIKAFVKWLLLKTLQLGRETADVQFEF